MRILMLSEHCCIRVIKQAFALMDAGHTVHFLHSRVANAELEYDLPWEMKYANERQLRAKLTGVGEGYDIIHVHNEPSSLAIVARECCPTTCVVLDCHDLNLCRHDLATAEEAVSMMSANALILPSYTYERMAVERMRLSIPTATVFSRLDADQRDGIKRQAYHGGLVYEGANRVSGTRLDYCNYLDVAKRCRENNIPFTMIQADCVNQREYMDAGCVTYGPLAYAEVLDALTRYDYGLCGPGKVPSMQWARTVPNKLYEYTAAGIPVITWPDYGEVASIVKREGIGIVLASPDKLDADMWRACLACRPSLMPAVLNARARWTMEAQVDTIVDLYGRALARMRARNWHPPPPAPDLSIVIATHNRLESLVPAIDSARQSCTRTEAGGKTITVTHEFVVVDGGSTDDTLQWLRSQPDVRLIEQGERLGAVRAYNAGFAAARGRYVAALNDDCRCVGPALSQACHCLDVTQEVGQVAIPWKDPHEPQPHICYESFAGRTWAYGNFPVTRRELGEKVGWWGTDYYFYGGDAELSLNLWAIDRPVADMTGGGWIAHSRDPKNRQPNRDSLKFRQKWSTWTGPAVTRTPKLVTILPDGTRTESPLPSTGATNG